jgi:hypothetical protein
MRNHKRSIGAPNSTGVSPAAFQHRAHFALAALACHAASNPADGAVELDEIHRFGLRAQPECRVLLRLVRDEAEEVPLRDHGQVLEVAGQVREVGQGHEALVRHHRYRRRPLLRQLLEAGQQVEVREHLQGGGMDDVASEVAEEVGVLLEDDDVDAGSGKHQPEQGARGSATHDADGRLRGDVLTNHGEVLPA